MFLKSEKNWKSFLTPEDERKMAELLERVAKYRGAYFNSEDVKTAQLWCALLEASKQNAALEARIKRLEYLIGGILSRSKRLDDARDALLDSIGKF